MSVIPVSGPARDVLTRDEAIGRQARVRDVHYDLTLDLVAGSPGYAGRATITFQVLPGASRIWLDATGGEPFVTLDGRTLDGASDGHRIVLPADLADGPAVVEVDYRNAYDLTGDGFHRFVDPEDGTEYVYSNFQPFDAHRMFPCFDQPDIKGTYQLTVDAPADWVVVSASRATVTGLPDGRRRHRFARTARFSTYLLPLVAGHWHAIHEERDGLALGLYARRSMARLVEREAAELFEVTRQGFGFYEELFDQPYPFDKYDQLFVPEFNAGAMENVGAVTFHDSFLFRDPPTEPERLTRAEVVLHELAHMWFGDLVTMRWWDDLWLNESFATYLSFLALDEATRFSAAWRQFNGTLKPQAYRDDQLVTTHPIASVVADTDEAELGFDGITYEKGASVLKQLVATIGRDRFRDGVRSYFRRHAWGNASLDDFLEALGSAAGTDLREWARLWIGTASLNTIETRWTAAHGRLTGMTLHQTAPPEHPTLRPHAMTIALVEPALGGDAVTTHRVTIDGAVTEVSAVVGLPAPAFVFPNHGDHDYAKVVLDERSLAFARERLAELDDPLLRQLSWSALWDMVRDARLSSTAYLAMIRDEAPAEPDPSILDSILDDALLALRRYVPERLRAAENHALVATASEVLGRGGTDDDVRLWLRLAIAAVSSPDDLATLLDMADGVGPLREMPIDQDMRWQLAVRSAAQGMPGADERVEMEAARDPSDRGQRQHIRALVARPDEAVKTEAWRRIHGEGYGSDYLTRAALAGFQWHHQRALLLPFRAPFFDEVPRVYRDRDLGFARAYLGALYPAAWGESAVLDRSRQLLDDLDPGDVQLRRHLLEMYDELERSIRVRAYAESTEA